MLNTSDVNIMIAAPYTPLKLTFDQLSNNDILLSIKSFINIDSILSKYTTYKVSSQKKIYFNNYWGYNMPQTLRTSLDNVMNSIINTTQASLKKNTTIVNGNKKLQIGCGCIKRNI